MDEEPRTRWHELTGGSTGEDYAARFAKLASSGKDMHGEATFCAGLAAPGGRILDAGCGTGRVAIRLAELGYEAVGVDVDESMLAVARREAPDFTWVTGDLAALPGPVTVQAPYDLVVMAGNVVPLLAPGTLAATMRGLSGLLALDGVLVAGFGLDQAHLPPRCPVTPLAEYDDAATAAGLVPAGRWSTWDAQPFREQDGYAVSVHRPA
ncbi:MAG: class I SAM-dependent methyltransferase [Nocardioides sp.]